MSSAWVNWLEHLRGKHSRNSRRLSSEREGAREEKLWLVHRCAILERCGSGGLDILVAYETHCVALWRVLSAERCIPCIAKVFLDVHFGNIRRFRVGSHDGLVSI